MKMEYCSKTDDQSDLFSTSSNREVDLGDLNAWEYLTANFDDANFLQDEPQFGASKCIAKKTPTIPCCQRLHVHMQQVHPMTDSSLLVQVLAES